MLRATAVDLLLNDRQLASLRNVVGRLTRRDVCDQLADLLACVIDRDRRVVPGPTWFI